MKPKSLHFFSLNIKIRRKGVQWTQERVRIEPGVGLLGCGLVKSAEALPTSTPKECSRCRNRRCRLRLDDSNVEVGTETADFNVFFAAEAETRRCVMARRLPPSQIQQSSQRSPLTRIQGIPQLRTTASQTLPKTTPTGH